MKRHGLVDVERGLCRDRGGRIRVFLNSCRHRGMKVCRYDEGNTLEFQCPYHGWSYATDGALVGVPFAKEAYGAALDKSRWGLIEVAAMENYKGTIWATWDRTAPPFLDYLGGYKLYLDLLHYAHNASRGTIARAHPYNYEMGLGRATREFEDHGLRLPGSIADVTTATASENNQRGFYRRWRQFMEAASWDELT